MDYVADDALSILGAPQGTSGGLGWGGISPAWVIVFLPAIWVAVTMLIAVLGGWGSLAERFSAREPPLGETLRMQSLSFGLLGNYREAINVTVGPPGVHLVPIVLFRLGHRPLLIPWREVAECTQSGTLLWKRTTLVLRNDDRRLRFAGRAGDAILRAWQARQAQAHF
jgi:hypothetical protein